ncbi:MAG: FxsA family protein [Gemmatimonadota bacterium]
MSLFSWLFLLFVGVPLLEIFVLVQVGQWMGVWPTIGLVMLTGFAGAALARFEGLRTLWKVKGELARGRLPGSALLDGFAILLGGILLLTPGILTDVVGFCFLLPPTRSLLVGRIRKSLERRLKSGAIRITHLGGFPVAGSVNWDGSGEWGPESKDLSGEIVIEAEGTRGT